MRKPKPRRAKTAKKTAKNSLIPQPNGKGALLPGGQPGNKGGGRMKSEVRAAALEGADIAIPFLIKVVKDAKAGKGPRREGIASSKVLLQFGLGTQTEVSVDDIRNRLTRQLEVLREELPAPLLDRILPRLRVIWVGS
jgi:hypothetical protein